MCRLRTTRLWCVTAMWRFVLQSLVLCNIYINAFVSLMDVERTEYSNIKECIAPNTIGNIICSSPVHIAVSNLVNVHPLFFDEQTPALSHAYPTHPNITSSTAPPRTAILSSSSQENLQDMESTLDMTAMLDVPMDGPGLHVNPPPRKHKRPLTRRMRGERNFTRLPLTPPSRPKAPKTYTATSYVGPRYADPRRFTLPDRHQPSYLYEDADPYEYAFEPRGTEYDYGCHGLNTIEPFSSYRNYGGISDPTQEPLEAICRRLNCWLDTPHTHDSEEILAHLDNEQKQVEYSSTEEEDELFGHRPARKKVKKSTKKKSTHAATSLLESSAKVKKGTKKKSTHATSLLESSAKSSQDLKRALPSTSELIPQATTAEANLAQLLTHRPPDRTMTLAIRPAASKPPLAQVAQAPVAKPRPPSEEEIQELLAKEAEAKKDESDGDGDGVLIE